jgi:hypothetical protein
MRKSSSKIHLEIQTSRRSPVGILRTTYWDKEVKKYRHTQHGRLTGHTLEELRMIQLAFRGKVTAVGESGAMVIEKSRELGASRAILGLARELNLHRLLYSRNEPWVDSAMAMIVGRIVYQGSKLSLCNQWENTCLWELCAIEGRPDVETHCYAAMDRLLERRVSIQKALAKKHLSQGSGCAGTLLLYDITSTYFEGEYKESELVRFGYNRDRKKGTKQVVIGLICNAQGCPIGSEVFEGNTNDASTVMDKISEIRDQYGLKQFVFVGDRGMVTQKRFEDIQEVGDIYTITALTHGQLNELQSRDVVQLELFDERNIIEISDPKDSSLRYCLCKNPQSAAKESATRKRLIELSDSALKEVANYKRSVSPEQLGARVGRALEKYKMGKFLTWRVEPASPEKSKQHVLSWEWDEIKISEEAALDGCYIIRTDVPTSEMETKEVVKAYKSLGEVERAFRNLKTVQLDMRPVYHKSDDRIRAHVFLCTLAYYVQWHMQQRLKPLFERDGAGDQREWTFDGVINRLKQISRHDITAQGVSFQQDTQPDEKQREIIELLSAKPIATEVKSGKSRKPLIGK